MVMEICNHRNHVDAQGINVYSGVSDDNNIIVRCDIKKLDENLTYGDGVESYGE